MQNYYNLIKSIDLQLDNTWVDTKNKENLLKELERLVEIGVIKEKEKNIKKCKCGRVEIDDNITDKINGKCYRIEKYNIYNVIKELDNKLIEEKIGNNYMNILLNELIEKIKKQDKIDLKTMTVAEIKKHIRVMFYRIYMIF